MKIKLTQGRITLIDDDDYDLVKGYRWHTQGNGKTWYAATGIYRTDGRHTTLLLHRHILGNTCEALQVDHINHDGLDNRRANLRICTRAENHQNMPPGRRGTSRYKGVDWRARTRSWRARIGVRGKRIRLGFFDNEIDAARAYDEAARKYFGKFACCNF